uniref:Uncharacterized protein n=1 Tax=mine drainage metagenome TaxID=410659 RepID=E6PG13_9ZZZZ
MNGDFAALAYLEWRTRVNTLRETFRTPARLVMLVLGIGYYAFFMWLRIANARAHGSPQGIHEPYATLAFCGAILLMALPAWTGARGVLKLFASFADARFLICSALREEHVIPFLVLRNNLFSIGRLAMLALLYALIFSTLGGLTGMMLGLLGLFLIGSVLSPFAFRMRVRFGAVVAHTLVVAIALVALVPAAAIGSGALWTGAQPLAHWALGLGFGRTLNALFAGNVPALLALYAVFVPLALASFVGARDLYPEIFAASYLGMKAVSQRSRGRARAFASRRSSDLPKTSLSSDIPRGMAGAWAILWKDWIGFRRVSGVQWLLGIGIAIGLGVGLTSGYLMRSPATSAIGLALLSMALFCEFAVISLLGTILLETDIGTPIWWLSTSSLRIRLYVWTAATAWRTILPLALGIAAYGFAVGNLAFVLLALPGAIVAIVLMRSIGIALYTIFPWNGGAGANAGMLRMLFSALALVPPAICFAVVVALTSDIAGGVLFGAIAALGETALFLEFASSRIAGNGVAMAREAAQ